MKRDVEWVSLKEFERRLGVGHATARRMRAEADFPAVQTSSHRWWVAWSEVDRFLLAWGRRQRDRDGSGALGANEGA